MFWITKKIDERSTVKKCKEKQDCPYKHKIIYIFVKEQPTITVTSTDLGYIVGTEDGDGTYVAAATAGIIDGCPMI